jgi:hypothetical protein
MKANRQFRKVVHVYCEGDTEKNYIRALCLDRYKKIRVDIFPNLKNGLESIFELLKEEMNCNEYLDLQGLFLVLDMDALHHHRQITEYTRDKQKLLVKDCERKLLFVESRPCIEYWFPLHYVFQDKLFIDCSAVIAELKKKDRLPDYAKNNRYTSGIYERTKILIDTAITNAIKVQCKKRVKGQDHSYTLLHELIQKLDQIENE